MVSSQFKFLLCFGFCFGLENEFEEYSGVSADGPHLLFPCGNFSETCSTSLGRRRWNRCHLA
jgi:hypothetical protein